MKEREIYIFSDILEKNKPAKVLEYGCGYSTACYPELLTDNAKWIAVEHDAEWCEKVRKMINKENTTVYCVPTEKDNPHQHVSERYTGDEKSFVSYVGKGKEFAPYDLILVDGMAREACIESAYDMLSENGLVVVHDANRPYYREAMKKFPYVAIFEDYRKTAGGIAFLSKSQPIGNYVDLRKHAKLWKKGTAWGNFSKFKFLTGKSKRFRLIENLAE